MRRSPVLRLPLSLHGLPDFGGDSCGEFGSECSAEFCLCRFQGQIYGTFNEFLGIALRRPRVRLRDNQLYRVMYRNTNFRLRFLEIRRVSPHGSGRSQLSIPVIGDCEVNAVPQLEMAEGSDREQQDRKRANRLAANAIAIWGLNPLARILGQESGLPARRAVVLGSASTAIAGSGPGGRKFLGALLFAVCS
jgi:hypothetical protein